MRSVLAAFYSHPWAWNEIGFGGPAYPRGYARLGIGLGEAWEGAEAFDVDPADDVKRRDGSSETRRDHFFKGSVLPARERLRVPARRRTAAAIPGRERMRRFRDERRGRPADRRLRRRRLGARTAPRARRLADRRARARAVLGSRRRLGLRRGRLAATSTGRTTRIIGGDDPVELGKNNSGHGVGGSMVHYAGYAPRFHPSDFETRTRDGVGCRLADLLLGPEGALRTRRARAAGRRPGLALGRSARLPARAAPDLAARPSAPGRARARTASRCASGRSRSRTASSATGRTASTAASACRAARSTPRPARSSRTCPTRSSTASRSAPTRWRSRIEIDDASGASPASPTSRSRAGASASSVPLRSPSAATRSSRPGCC